MFTRSGDQIEIATFRALRRANSSITDTKLIFLKGLLMWHFILNEFNITTVTSRIDALAIRN